MGLESTMICLDNSEWMRNGDYTPTRMEAQHDAANLISGAKTQANPESTVGVLTMAGNRCELLVSPTDDMSKILNSLHNVPLKGALNFCAAVQVAQLALKHRRNKHGGQRIIVFVGSPVQDEQRPMVKAAKLLKKNNVACDIVSMGELDENQEKLQAFIEACNSNDNSHLITIPAGVLPSDVLISSPIIQERPGGGGGGGGDVDPNMDPELAMALRVSMEEERARQERAAAAGGGGGAEGGGAAEGGGEGGSGGAWGNSVTSTPTMPPWTGGHLSTMSPPPPRAVDAMMDEEERLLQQALAMSMAEAGGGSGGAPAAEEAAAAPSTPRPAPAGGGGARQVLVAATAPAPAPAPAAAEAKPAAAAAATAAAAAPGGAQQFLDPAFVNSLLGSLPGVDPSDPKIQVAV
ncbi:unnamed protein product [Heterosigma akashiwo]